MSHLRSAVGALIAPFRVFLDKRDLTLELAKREVLGRYRGATFGLLWSIASPFLLLIVYTLAFGTVMKARWPEVAEGRGSFALILFVGLIVHGFFSECLIRSPNLITGNPNFVKRVIFPLDILPWSMVISALFHTLTNILVFLLLRLIMEGTFEPKVILLPLVFLPLVLLALGVAWFLASLGVYFRDINQVTGVVATALLFLSSAMIPLSVVPESFKLVFQLNPLTFIIDQAREVVLWGNWPDWAGMGMYLLVALGVFYGGYAWFHATRRGFADVI